MTKEELFNEALFKVDYDYFNNKNLDIKNLEVNPEALEHAINVNACFIVNKVLKLTDGTKLLHLNSNNLIINIYEEIIYKLEQDLYEYGEELKEFIILDNDNEITFCPKFYLEEIKKSYKWKMIEILWGFQNVKTTLNKDCKELYKILMTETIDKKVKNF